MLDDLKMIHQLDAQDALGIAGKQYQQLQVEFDVPPIQHASLNNIVVAGMGGSPLAALMSTTWPCHEVPFEISRSYTIPQYVDRSTFFIASSYSGNTEETLEALEQAEERGARIAIMASGGKLISIAQEKNYPFVRLPAGYQPRHATLFGLNALTALLAAAGFIDRKQAREEIDQASNFLHHSITEWRPDVPTSQNQPKQIAQDLAGKSPVIYSGPLMFPASYKWKISINENAKTVAWCNQLPEFNHNEFLGWTSHPIDKPYAVVDLRSSFEHSRVQKRFKVSERLLSGKRPAPIIIEAQGSTVLEQLLWLSAFGDFTSLYLTLLNGLNPTPVDLIEKLKKSLDE